VSCSKLQYVACVAEHEFAGSVLLQCVACSSKLQCVAEHEFAGSVLLHCVAVCCSVLQNSTSSQVVCCCGV